jgi:hypothetical protein
MNIFGIYIQQLQHPFAGTIRQETFSDGTGKLAMSLSDRIRFNLGSATFLESTSTGFYQYEPMGGILFSSFNDRWKFFTSLRIPDSVFLNYVNGSIMTYDQDLKLREVNGKYKLIGTIDKVTCYGLTAHSQY